MPYYGQWGGPAEYAQQQQAQKQQMFQNLLRMMLMAKQTQEERAIREREWQYKVQQDAIQRGLDERRTSAYEKAAEPRRVERQTPEWMYKLEWASKNLNPEEFKTWWMTGKLPMGTKDLADIEARAKAQAAGARAGNPPKPDKPPSPTAHDKKKSGLDVMLKEGKITLEQYNESLYGIKPKDEWDVPPTPTIPTFEQMKEMYPGLTKDRYAQLVHQYKMKYGIK